MIPSDVKFYLSGGSSNTDPNLSLGDEISATQMTSNVLQNLFANVSGAERLAGSVRYRCVYVKNTHATESLDLAGVFIPSNTTSPQTSMHVGVDPAGIGDGASTGVAVIIPDDVTSPMGVVFDHSPLPTSKATGLALGSPSLLSPGMCAALWLRRTVDAGASALANDLCTLRIDGIIV